MHMYSASQRLMVMICLVAFLCAFTSGVISYDPKRPPCCKEDMLTLKKPKINITKCYIFPAKGKCAEAVAFTAENKMYCINPKAKWLNRTMNDLKKMGVICEDYTKSKSSHMGI